MKFVCDNCQAKYQIGDDKVAGKTVRMKCRKCGYNIKVPAGGGQAESAAPDATHDAAHEAGHDGSHDGGVADVPPASVQIPSPGAAAPPRPAAAGGPPRPAGAGAPPRPTAAAPPRPTGSASPGAWAGDDDESTAMMSLSVRDAVVAATATAPRPASPAKPPPARSITPAPHAAPERPRSITHTGTPRPAAGPPLRHSTGSLPAARPVTRTSTGSLAAVKLDPSSHSSPHLVLEPEWYVGIAGSPIGPVRVSVIRERAAANEVDGESLVWREGMGEWRPLRTFPELLEVVTAAHGPPPPAPRPAGLTPAPVDVRPFAAVAGLAASVPAPLAAAPPPAAAAPFASTVASATAPLAAAPPAPAPAPAAPAAVSQPAPPPTAVLPDALVVPAPALQNGLSNGAHVEVAAPAAALKVASPAAPRVARDDQDTSLEDSLIPRRRGGVHPMAYAFVAAAATFGAVAAWVLLRPQPPPQVVVVQAPPPPTPGQANTVGSVTDKGATTAEVEVGEITTPGSSGTARVASGTGPRPKGTASATTSTPVAPMDTSSFQNVVPGPAATAATPAPNGGGQLSSGEISAVVAQNQAIIKRKCWVPALEAKAPSAPANARVVGNLVIGASGSVESASASGGERDFPGLSSCISSRMKNWKFPPSGSSTPVNVPFVFAGQ
jgi:predicted Zn finger-like uncharacterized protein